MRGHHLCVRKQTGQRKGTCHYMRRTLQEVTTHCSMWTGRHRTWGEGGVLETGTNTKGLHTMGNSQDWLHRTVQVLQIDQSVLKWSSVSNTMHRIHGGCLVAYAHSTAPPLTAMQHSGQRWRGWYMYIGCCTGHTCRNGSTAVQSSQVRRPSTTYRWCMVHTRESWFTQPAQPAWEERAASLVQLTEDLTDAAQTLH